MRTQLVKKFQVFYGTQRFMTVFTSARHLHLSVRRVCSEEYLDLMKVDVKGGCENYITRNFLNCDNYRYY